MPADPRTPRQEQIQCQELSEIPQWAMETANRIGMMMPLDSQTKISHAARIIAEACQQQIAAAAQARLEEHQKLCDVCDLINRNLVKDSAKSWACPRRTELEAAVKESHA